MPPGLPFRNKGSQSKQPKQIAVCQKKRVTPEFKTGMKKERPFLPDAVVFFVRHAILIFFLIAVLLFHLPHPLIFIVFLL
jgi:hypothetical protein